MLVVNQEGPVAGPELPEQPIPEGLDWDAWTNQAPLLPTNDELYTSFSKYRYDDGGQVTNWVHALDMVQFALGKDYTGPVKLWPVPDYEGPPHLRPVRMRYADESQEWPILVFFHSSTATMASGASGTFMTDSLSLEKPVDPESFGFALPNFQWRSLCGVRSLP